MPSAPSPPGALGPARIAELLTPYVGDGRWLAEPVWAGLPVKLATYLDLLLRWNARTNLTAIRDPEEMVRRHFGESVFAARLLREHLAEGDTLLDLGSGAGFPGLPIALCLPGIRVTLAESQGKKAAFLREAVRTLRADVEVWAQRAEVLPVETRFSAVTLRAVDNPALALKVAVERCRPGGLLLELGTGGDSDAPLGADSTDQRAMPDGSARELRLWRVPHVPRGT